MAYGCVPDDCTGEASTGPGKVMPHGISLWMSFTGWSVGGDWQQVKGHDLAKWVYQEEPEDAQSNAITQ